MVGRRRGSRGSGGADKADHEEQEEHEERRRAAREYFYGWFHGLITLRGNGQPHHLTLVLPGWRGRGLAAGDGVHV